MSKVTVSPSLFTKEIEELQEALRAWGIHGALQYLNKRTPHRFTGIYKYDGKLLRNLALYDKYNSYLTIGEDVPMKASYCSLLEKQQALEINDITQDKVFNGIITTPVISYCGVLMKDSAGNPFGSLCNYDMKRCQARSTGIPLLNYATELLYNYLNSNFSRV